MEAITGWWDDFFWGSVVVVEVFVVALIMANRPEYLFAVHGLAKIGAAAALINTNLTGQPLAHAITVGNSRKGVAGDWKNYFTPPVKEAFKRHYGSLLVDAGYESDLDW